MVIVTSSTNALNFSKQNSNFDFSGLNLIIGGAECVDLDINGFDEGISL